MKTQNINHRIRAGSFVLTALICLLTVFTSQAQDLIVHLGYTPPLDQKQQKYLRTITENPINERVTFVEINMEALKGERLTLNLSNAQKYEVNKVERGQNMRSITSWCGQIVDYENGGGDVNMVRVGEELVGHFTVDDMIYAVTHIGEGLHVLYEVNSTKAPAEDCNIHDISPTGIKEKPYEITEPDYVNNLSEQKLSGDCRIRVLVGFTPTAEAGWTSIIGQINNLINVANTAFDYGNVNFNIELAHAYRVNYTAIADRNFDLTLWQGTSDGFMDEVHFLRGLWRADQCALIVAGDGGIATLSVAYENQFSVTGTGNFNVFTFHHELGHNMLCTHDIFNTSQPGDTPYAGYGDPFGCFRTVMAYPEACFAGDCGRVNVFSSSFGTYSCGGSDLIIGSNDFRNRDRLVLSRPFVINHQVSPTDAVYIGNYAATANEAIHMASNFSFTYSGFLSNTFTFFDGSEGSFRATDVVAMGPGFRANEGAFFEAYLDNCPQLLAPGMGEDSGTETESTATIDDNSQFGAKDVKVFPNPFNQRVTIEFSTLEYDRVSIEMYDMMGQKVMQALDNPNLAPGMHLIEINTADLPSGVYSIALDSNGNRTVTKVVKNR
ncbi:zinc-dependent metalloprotease [Cryomorphaceae bacterium 1068]|nr:zinc-dependent metalloprotease [Cryomorphaceae bacterium 1068]